MKKILLAICFLFFLSGCIESGSSSSKSKVGNKNETEEVIVDEEEPLEEEVIVDEEEPILEEEVIVDEEEPILEEEPVEEIEEPVEETPIVSEPISENSAALSWNAPFEREDGTKFEIYEISHYTIKYRLDEFSAELVIDDYSANSFVFEDLEPGEYFFSIRVTDIDGNDSRYSKEVSKKII